MAEDSVNARVKSKLKSKKYQKEIKAAASKTKSRMEEGFRAGSRGKEVLLQNTTGIANTTTMIAARKAREEALREMSREKSKQEKV